ncbi:hypothetical protein VTL71DRAFT_7449 [Oculimacula yallundae]|uniref:Uncharacterized protein n=1 Tax=Oculimacula yallundae TaxID=86028 RepID=A0ABR4BVC4_9HELO
MIVRGATEIFSPFSANITTPHRTPILPKTQPTQPQTQNPPKEPTLQNQPTKSSQPRPTRAPHKSDQIPERYISANYLRMCNFRYDCCTKDWCGHSIYEPIIFERVCPLAPPICTSGIARKQPTHMCAACVMEDRRRALARTRSRQRQG